MSFRKAILRKKEIKETDMFQSPMQKIGSDENKTLI